MSWAGACWAAGYANNQAKYGLLRHDMQVHLVNDGPVTIPMQS